VISDFFRGELAFRSRLKAAGKREVSISTVTAMEIEYGFLLNPSRARKFEPVIRLLLTEVAVLPYEHEDATATAAVRAALAKRVAPIGPFDLMIAGTALRSGLAIPSTDATSRALY
jgi:tRNA(fMet)-specific endonuclease VapC